MTRDIAIAVAADGLPNTFVPGRNLLFLTFAAALAYRRGVKHLVAGVCETDYSGYPDCRDDTIKALQVAPQSRHGAAFRHRDAADVDRQGGDLASGARPRRRGARRDRARGDAHLLQRRPQPPSRMGMGLRGVPRLRATRGGLRQVPRRGGGFAARLSAPAPHCGARAHVAVTLSDKVMRPGSIGSGAAADAMFRVRAAPLPTR